MPIFKKSPVPVVPLIVASLVGFWWVKESRAKRLSSYSRVVCEPHLGHTYCIWQHRLSGLFTYSVDGGAKSQDSFGMAYEAGNAAKALIESL